MKGTSSTDYRSRIHAAYVTARDQALAPGGIAGLRSRLPYFRRILRLDFPSFIKAAIPELGCWHDALRSPHRFRAPGTNPFLRRQGWGRV